MLHVCFFFQAEDGIRDADVTGVQTCALPILTQDAIAAKLVDRVVPINGGEALRLSRELAAKEGIFVGITGGATLSGALAVADTAPEGSVIVCMLPDTGERYLSTPLFADIPAD